MKSSGYASGFNFITFGLHDKLEAYAPDLVVLNEFGLLSLYGMISAKGMHRTRALLVMEAVPRFGGRRGLDFGRLLFRRLLAKGADAVLTNNGAGRSYLTDVLHVPEQKIIARPYLVSSFANAAGKEGNRQVAGELRQNGPEIHYLYVGQLIERKGLQYAFEACAKLLPELSGRFVFDVVGDGTYRAELEEKCRSLRLCDHVVFHGRKDYEALGPFYEKADVFLFPTLADYRALAPFEAMSAGLPIVASVHDGGISETVSEGENGFTFDPFDTGSLALLMRKIIEDPSLIHDFSLRSLEKSKCYTLNNAVAAFIESCALALDK